MNGQMIMETLRTTSCRGSQHDQHFAEHKTLTEMKKKTLLGASISRGSSDSLGFSLVPQSFVPAAAAATATMTISNAAGAVDVSHVTRGPAASRLPAALVSSGHAPAAAFPRLSMITAASPTRSPAPRALNFAKDIALPSLASGGNTHEKTGERELPFGACRCADAKCTSPSESRSSVDSGDRMSWDCKSCLFKGCVKGTHMRCSVLGRGSSGFSVYTAATTAASFAALPVHIASAVFPAEPRRAAAAGASAACGDRGTYAVAPAFDECASAVGSDAVGRRVAGTRHLRRLYADVATAAFASSPPQQMCGVCWAFFSSSSRSVAGGMEGYVGATPAAAKAPRDGKRSTVPVSKDTCGHANALHPTEICGESPAVAPAAGAAQTASQSAIALCAAVPADGVAAVFPAGRLSAAGGSATAGFAAAKFGTAGFAVVGAPASKRGSAAAATRARACMRRCGMSATARSPFILREGGGWQNLRRVAAAAAVCLISAAVAEAIVCRIDASEGLLAAAVAAGSAMPAAEIYSFPLCRLPYLVNSDVPARDAPHIGLYTGGTIEIELELLPSDSYANNLPLPEPRFHEKDTVFHLHQPQKRQRQKDAEAAGAATASSPRRQNERQNGFFECGETPAAPRQQQQKDSSAAAPVGSVTRELASFEDLNFEVPDNVSSSGSASTPVARSGQAIPAAGGRIAARRESVAAEGTRRGVVGGVTTTERKKKAGSDTATLKRQAAVRIDGAPGAEAVNRSGGSRGGHGSPMAEEEAVKHARPLNEILFQQQFRIPDEEERREYFSFDNVERSTTSSDDWATLQRRSRASLAGGVAAFSSDSGSRVQTDAAGIHFDVTGAVNIEVEGKRIADAAAAASSTAATSSIATSPCTVSAEKAIPVTPSSSGSPSFLEMISSFPSVSSHVTPGLRAAVASAFTHVQRITGSLRVYVARIIHSVAAAADLFFGIQSTPLLLPVSLKTTSTGTHASAATAFDAERAALSQPQPSSAGVLSVPLLFPTLYYPAPLPTAPSSRGSALSLNHPQEKQNQKQQQRVSVEPGAGEQQQLLDGTAGRERMKNREEEAAAAVAADATEEHGDVFTADIPLRSTAEVTRRRTVLSSFGRDSDADTATVAAGETAAAPRRLLKETEWWLPGMQAVAEDPEEVAKLTVHEERKKRRTEPNNSAEGTRIRKASSGTTANLGEESGTGEDSLWRRKKTLHRGEQKHEEGNAADAHQQLFQFSPNDSFTTLYDGDYVHDVPFIQQQQQIAAAAAAWQLHLRENYLGPVQAEDPLIYTVNNTYVLVMNHFQYMLFQQDNGWLRSFTASEGAVAKSYVPAYKRLTFTGPKLHARVEVPQLDRYAVVLLNADGLDLRLRGRITFLNPQHQQLSVEQIPLPKLLFFLMLMHFFTAVLLAVVMLSFRRRRWTRIHILILGNLLFCTLSFALDRSQTLYFKEHGQKNSVLWLAARVCKKLQDIVALMAFILIALGWKTLRSQLSRIEVQFVAGLCVISLYLGLFEIILGGFQGTRYILHALGYVCVLVAINFNLALLHSHIMEAGISATTSDLYHKYDAFRMYRGIFFLYLLKPVSLIFFKLSLLNPIYEQLLSWDEWIFVFANNAIDYGIFLALFYAFRPGGTMRILREVSQTTASDTQSGQAADANAWTPG